MNNGYQGFDNNSNNNNMRSNNNTSAMLYQCMTWMLICATCPFSVPILFMMCCLQGTFPMMGDFMPPGLGSDPEAPEISDYSGTV